MNKLTKVFFILLLAFLTSYANSDLKFADSCYKARAERAIGDKADAKNANLMIKAYRKAMKDSSVQEKATEGYAKSLYFSFRFVPFDKSKRKQKLDSLKQQTEDAYNKFPKNKTIAYIYASSLSMWGAEKNPLAAIKDGFANKVRDIAEKSKNYQILGRAHQLLPYLPLILPWPDKSLAEKYLTLALEQDPYDTYTYFFLAELRFDQKRYDEAQSLITKGLSIGARPDYLMEDRRGRWHLKELQKKLNKKLGK